MYKIKIKDVYKDFSKDKEMSDFRSYSAKSRCFDDSNKSVVEKMKNETGDVVILKSVRAKPMMYLLLVDDSNEHKKATGVNKKCCC